MRMQPAPLWDLSTGLRGMPDDTRATNKGDLLSLIEAAAEAGGVRFLPARLDQPRPPHPPGPASR
jgi:hypothetical protein